jgi:hypothetical protein
MNHLSSNNMNLRYAAALSLFLLASCMTRAAAQPPWDDYQIIMYQEQTPRRLEGLRELGVTAGKVIGLRTATDADRIATAIAPLREAKMPWYVENIATDFYAAYHRWTPEHPEEVNWRFLALQAQHRRDRADRSVFIRDPSLSDGAWLNRIRARLADNVRIFAPYRPLYYNLADESGIADLAAAWDFDFSPTSVSGFRTWLRTQYASLDALNAEWGTHFATWDEIAPATTTEAMQRARQNFSPWADFKAWMDEAFARAIRAGTDALHAADPAAVSAIEGAQVPGWGGYDYTRLAGAVDLMEVGDAGNNVEIVRSLNPGMKLLTTSSGGGGEESHRIWHELLLGERGLIIWDEGHDFVDDEGRPGPRAQAAAPLYAELRGGIGAQLIAATPHSDPVAILYSPASLRTEWMLAQRLMGDAWTGRSSAQESEDNSLRAATRRAASILTHLGITPRFVSSAQIESGALQSLHALLLPHAVALSDAEEAAIRTFATRGGLVLADVEPGTFDEHSRRRTAPPLADLRTHGIEALPDRSSGMQGLLERARVAPVARIQHADGTPVTDVDVRTFDDGPMQILALQRDWTGAQPASETIVLTLGQKRFVRNLRDGAEVFADTLTVTLEAVAPTLLVLASERLPPPTVAISSKAGELRLAGSPGEVVHLDLIDSRGEIARRYSGNTVLRDGSAIWPVPITGSDAEGWIVRARGVLSGGLASAPLEVR